MNGRDADTRVLVALARVEKLSPRRRELLLEQATLPSGLLSAEMKPALSAALGDALTDFYRFVDEADAFFDGASEKGIGWVTRLDDEYSDLLRETDGCPPVLFTKGNAGLLNSFALAIVGTRRPTRYGAKIADEFAREFAADNFSTDDYADIVRVACHPDEIAEGVEDCEILQDTGYEAFLHLMDVAHITDEQMQALKAYDRDNVIYFADSYGALLPEDIRKYFRTFAQAGFEKIGFHAHNNKQLAFINTLTAIECGAYSVDVSAYGMGRAAGNTPAELLLSQLGRNVEPYFELIEKYYLDLYEKTSWGYSLKNLEGGIKNIKVS